MKETRWRTISFRSNRFRLQSYEKKHNYANSLLEKSFYFASPRTNTLSCPYQIPIPARHPHHTNSRPSRTIHVQFPYYSRTIKPTMTREEAWLIRVQFWETFVEIKQSWLFLCPRITLKINFYLHNSKKSSIFALETEDGVAGGAHAELTPNGRSKSPSAEHWGFIIYFDKSVYWRLFW